MVKGASLSTRVDNDAPFTMAYHKVREIGCVETQNICVKKLIVPPKNILCFDTNEEWPNRCGCYQDIDHAPSKYYQMK